MKNPLRIISIMSTTKAHNLSVYSMMQKRDFLNRDTDNFCQKRAFNIPKRPKKRGVFPVLPQKRALFAQWIQGA